MAANPVAHPSIAQDYFLGLFCLIINKLIKLK